MWNADRTANKTHFFDFLSLVYFVYDARSDYSYIIDEEGVIEKVMPKVKPDTNAAEILEYLNTAKQ